MQICQIALYMRDNLSKASQLCLTCRANCGKINKDVQSTLDQVSGLIGLLTHQFDNSSTYFAEGHFIIFEAIAKLCGNRMSELISLKERNKRQNVDCLLGLEIGSKQVIPSQQVDQIIDQIYLLAQNYNIQNKNYNKIIEIQKQLLEQLQNNYFIEQSLNYLFRSHLKVTCKQLISKYNDIELSYLSTLIGLDQEILKQEVIKLIEDEQINYIIDSDGYLVKRQDQASMESVQILKTANQVVQSIMNKIQSKQ